MDTELKHKSSLHLATVRKGKDSNLWKHGLYGHSLYQTWNRMRSRCLGKKSRWYKNWGGRGIKICPEWDSFAVFLADMGEKPSPKHSLDRIDNNGNYCKENCRWATWKEQENNRGNNKVLTFQNKTQTISQWATEKDLRVDTLWRRIQSGWTVERALTTNVIWRGQRKYGNVKI